MIIHCLYDELVPIDELKPHPKNNNKHSKEQIERLAKILRYQGFRYPIKVSKRTQFITSGHARLLAAKLNKWTEVPVNFQDYESDEQEYADITSDNSIASWSELDLSMINLELPDLGPDFDIDLLGIKNFKIDVAENGLVDEDEIPEPKESICKPGDIWQLGDHRLMCGDSTQIDSIEKLMNCEKAKMCFTDPPYGVNYQKKNKMLNGLQPSLGRLETAIHGDDMSLDELKQMIGQVFKNIYISLDEKSSYYVCAPQGGELGLMMMMMQESGIPCRHMIIWVKNNAAFSMNRLDYDYKHEPILYGWPAKRTHEFYGGGDFKNSVWQIDRENNKLHPTMKPVGIMQNAIKNSTQPKELVIDFFGGSGSTLIACESTGRKCNTMEIFPNYCDIIIERWQNFTGKKANLAQP